MAEKDKLRIKKPKKRGSVFEVWAEYPDGSEHEFTFNPDKIESGDYRDIIKRAAASHMAECQKCDELEEKGVMDQLDGEELDISDVDPHKRVRENR